MAESLELHVVRAFFAKAEKKSPFSDVSFLFLKDCKKLINQLKFVTYLFQMVVVGVKVDFNTVKKDLR